MQNGKKNQNDARSFEDRCVDYLGTLYISALSLTKEQDDAEDLVQETFFKAYKSAKTFRRGTNLKAWLFRILINNYRNYCRRKQRAPTSIAYVDELPNEISLENTLVSHAPDPEVQVFSRFFAHAFIKALGDLPDEFRLVVILSDLVGFSYKEIAGLIGRPIGTVTSRLHRGRQHLQRALIDFALDSNIISNPKDARSQESQEIKACA